MAYERLDYAQYFIDTSEDYNHTGKARRKIEYQAVSYDTTERGEKLSMAHEVNYEMHYEEDRDVIQIHFQKTNGKSDWFTNIVEFSDKYYDAFDFEGAPLELRVHHGWGTMYKAIKRVIRSEWQELHEAHPDAETEVIGWSLGSGQAILCCQDLNFNFGVKPYLYTFGTVRPFKAKRGSRELLDRYLNGIYSDCCNFANRNDIVTYMPPFRGFTMLNRVELGDSKRTLAKLLKPTTYHTIYDHSDLYKNL